MVRRTAVGKNPHWFQNGYPLVGGLVPIRALITFELMVYIATVVVNHIEDYFIPVFPL
jgi:hypothetical protein